MTVSEAFAACENPATLKHVCQKVERLIAEDLHSLPSVLKRVCDEVLKCDAVPVDVDIKWLSDCESIEVKVFGVKA